MSYEQHCPVCLHDFPLAHMELIDTFTGLCPECTQPINLSPAVSSLRKAEEQVEYLQGLLYEAIWHPTMGSELERCTFCDISEIADKHEEHCKYAKAVGP